MRRGMTDIIPIALLLLALAGAMALRGFLHAALARAAEISPQWRAGLDRGAGWRLGGDAASSAAARRRFVGGMIRGGLPREIAEDAVAAQLIARLKLSALAVLLGIGGVVLIAALRA